MLLHLIVICLRKRFKEHWHWAGHSAGNKGDGILQFRSTGFIRSMDSPEILMSDLFPQKRLSQVRWKFPQFCLFSLILDSRQSHVMGLLLIWISTLFFGTFWNGCSNIRICSILLKERLRCTCCWKVTSFSSRRGPMMLPERLMELRLGFCSPQSVCMLDRRLWERLRSRRVVRLVVKRALVSLLCPKSRLVKDLL